MHVDPTPTEIPAPVRTHRPTSAKPRYVRCLTAPGIAVEFEGQTYGLDDLSRREDRGCRWAKALLDAVSGVR